jgi:NitT/TauT family transport system ATP-binding protein
MTVVFVTHDVDEAVFLSDRVVVLTRRPGRIKAEIPVDLPRPRDQELLTSPGFTALKRQALNLLLGETVRPPGPERAVRPVAVLMRNEQELRP